MRRFVRALVAVSLLFVIHQAVFPQQAHAHERRNVGKYQLVVGFFEEPAIEGMRNGVSLRITTADTDKPVEGAEKTLKVDIISGGKSKTLSLRPVFRQPGRYTADLIPTRPGTYVFRFSGNIEGTPVEERFESGPGRFNDVEAAGALYFPEPMPDVGAVQKEMQNATKEAQGTAAAARLLGIGGLVLGAMGIVAGGASLSLALRKGKTGSA